MRRDALGAKQYCITRSNFATTAITATPSHTTPCASSPSSPAELSAVCALLTATMRIRRTQCARQGGACETSSSYDSPESRINGTHTSAASYLPAFGSASVSDPVSTSPARLQPRDHDDEHESPKIKIVAGTVAGVGMLLLGGLALIWYMMWKRRRRRQRMRALEQAHS